MRITSTTNNYQAKNRTNFKGAEKFNEAKKIILNNIADPQKIKTIRFGKLEDLHNVFTDMINSLTVKTVELLRKNSPNEEISVQTSENIRKISVNGKEKASIAHYDRNKGDVQSGVTYWDRDSGKMFGVTSSPNDSFHLFEMTL